MLSVWYIVSILVYEVLAVVLPLPIEAPMFLFPELHRVSVALLCGVGKGLGTYLVLRSRKLLQSSGAIEYIATSRPFGKIWRRLDGWALRFGSSYGFVGFVICQGTPGLPMRGPIYSAAILGMSPIQFAVGSGLGAVSRCAIVFGTIKGIKELF